MVDRDRSWRSKVAPDLTEALNDAPGAALSALVEIELARPRVAFDGDPRRGERIRPRFLENASAADDEEQRFTLAAEALENITEKPPHRIRAAGAFVVDVTEDEVERIAGLDCVRRITLNRRLR